MDHSQCDRLKSTCLGIRCVHLILFILACGKTFFFHITHFEKHDGALEIKKLFVFLNPRFTFIYDRIQHLVIHSVTHKSQVIYHFFTKKQARFSVKLCRCDVVLQGVSLIVSMCTAGLSHSKPAHTGIHNDRCHIHVPAFQRNLLPPYTHHYSNRNCEQMI
jgi:hypothetical protein